MENISFKEIIETSSQKSLLTGNPGFGVRTYTQSMAKEKVNSIYRGVMANYELPMQRKVNVTKLKEDPDVVCGYPMTYRYNKVDTGNGNTTCTFTRSVYVGIDYGYFCGKESAMRAGDNYLSHTLIPEHPFRASMLSLFTEQNVFFPKDRSCRPDNAEYQQLLTGEPTPLQPRMLPVSVDVPLVDELTGKLAVVFLQTKVNKDLGEKPSLSKVVIKAAEEKVLGLIARMAALPDGLVEPMTFQTNYLQGGGLPSVYNMVFVNEYCQAPMYEAGYVVFDVNGMSFGNVTSNYYFDQVLDAAKHGNHAKLSALIEFLLSWKCTPETDYQFVYRLFKMKTSDDITIDDLTENFFDTLFGGTCVTDTLSVVKSKVAVVINSLLSGMDTSQKTKALDVCRFLSMKYPQMLDISDGTKQEFTDAVFASKNTLSQLIDRYDADFVLGLVTTEISMERFLDAMTCVSDSDLWKRLLAFYFGEDKAQNMHLIIDAILQSRVSQKQVLIMEIYPYDKFASRLHKYLLERPSRYNVLADIITSICNAAADWQTFNGRVAGFVSKLTTLPQDVIPIFSKLISDYYLKKAEDNMAGAVESMLKISVDIRQMRFNDLVNKFYEYVQKNPAQVPSSLITELDEKVTLPSDVKKNLFIIRSIIDNEPENLGAITTFEILMAKRVENEQLVTQLFKQFLQRRPTDEKIKQAVKDGSPMSYEAGKELVDSVWKDRQLSAIDRERMVLCLYKALGWSGKQQKEFLTNCNDLDLVNLLKKNAGVLQRIVSSMSKIPDLFKQIICKKNKP